jgi:hypothetical protein
MLSALMTTAQSAGSGLLAAPELVSLRQQTADPLRVVGLDRIGSRAERRGGECEASGESKAADHWETPEGEMGGALCVAASAGVLKSS